MKDNKKNKAEAAAKAEEKKARAAADPAPEGETPEEAPEESNNITITREKLEELNAYVKAAEQKRDEYLAMAQRVQADFDNYRKRNASLRTEVADDAVRDAVKEVLPGTVFDPEKHNAVMMTEADEEHPEGTIIECFQTGFAVRGKVVRYAMVRVAN